MKRLIATTSLLALMSWTADAAIIPPWNMGGNPCAGTCTPDWAVDAIRDGLGHHYAGKISAAMTGPGQRMTVPAGSVNYAMSYGGQGDGPEMSFTRTVVAEDTVATVWDMGDGFIWAYFDQTGQCINWALIWVGERNEITTQALYPALAGYRGGGYSYPAVWTSGFASGLGVGSYWASGVVGSSHHAGDTDVYVFNSETTLNHHDHKGDYSCEECHPMIPTNPTPVPVPSSIWLALASVFGLAVLGWRAKT